MSNFLAHALVPEVPAAVVATVLTSLYGCAILSIWLAIKRRNRAAIWFGSIVTAIAVCAAAPSIVVMVFSWWLIHPALLFILGVAGILLALRHERLH